MKQPPYVKNFDKPPGTGVHESGGHWYLYKVSYHYDRTKKRTMRHLDEYLGSLDENGFHPKKRRVEEILQMSEYALGYEMRAAKAPREARDAPAVPTSAGDGKTTEASSNEDGDSDEVHRISAPSPSGTDKASEACANEDKSAEASDANRSPEPQAAGDKAAETPPKRHYTPHKYDPRELPMGQIVGIRTCPPVVEYGYARWLFDTTEDIRKQLSHHFPLYARQLFVTAGLGADSYDALERIPIHYENSGFSLLFPGLALSGPTLSRMLDAIGRQPREIKAFLRDSIKDVDGEVVAALIDGHRFLTSARGVPSAKIGYDSKKRYKPQLNVLSELLIVKRADVNVRIPAFYSPFPGNTNDITALSSAKDEMPELPAGTMEITDTGFDSTKLLNDRVAQGLESLGPLKRNNQYVKDQIPKPGSYPIKFKYRGRTIEAKAFPQDGKPFDIYLMFDQRHYDEEVRSIRRRVTKKNAENARKVPGIEEQLAPTTEMVNALKALSTDDAEAQEKRQKTLAILEKRKDLLEAKLKACAYVDPEKQIAERPTLGTITLRCSAKGLPAKLVYFAYKGREGIENYFKTKDDTLGQTGSFMKLETTLLGWFFLTYLSSVFAMRMINMIKERGKTKEYSLRTVSLALSQIRVQNISGQTYQPQMSSWARNVCAGLDISIADLLAPPPGQSWDELWDNRTS